MHAGSLPGVSTSHPVPQGLGSHARCALREGSSRVSAAAPILPLARRRGAKVVLVAGDTGVDNRRSDPRLVQRAIDALKGSKVAQLVLVTPVGGPQGTGIFGFGGSKGRSDALSKLEEQVGGGGGNSCVCGWCRAGPCASQ